MPGFRDSRIGVRSASVISGIAALLDVFYIAQHLAHPTPGGQLLGCEASKRWDGRLPVSAVGRLPGAGPDFDTRHNALLRWIPAVYLIDSTMQEGQNFLRIADLVHFWVSFGVIDTIDADVEPRV